MLDVAHVFCIHGAEKMKKFHLQNIDYRFIYSKTRFVFHSIFINAVRLLLAVTHHKKLCEVVWGSIL